MLCFEQCDGKKHRHVPVNKIHMYPSYRHQYPRSFPNVRSSSKTSNKYRECGLDLNFRSLQSSPYIFSGNFSQRSKLILLEVAWFTLSISYTTTYTKASKRSDSYRRFDNIVKFYNEYRSLVLGPCSFRLPKVRRPSHTLTSASHNLIPILAATFSLRPSTASHTK